MKFRKTISLLVICIVVLSLAASFYGVFSNQGQGKYEFNSLHNKTIAIYGKGLYRNDSVSLAAQAIAQDIVTMILSVPLLIISLYLSRKGLLKGKLLLAGAIGYFLYTYTSYSFLMMYNQLFLIYVAIMSASFFAFTLVMMSFDLEGLSSCFSPKLPVKFIGGFLIFFGVAIGLMWLGMIIPPLMNGRAPLELEHYTTLCIQALDLGFVVPVAIVSGVLLIKRKPFGYLLASVIITKVIAMLSAVTAMAIGMVMAGVEVDFAQMLLFLLLFPLFNLVAIYCLVLIIKNIKEVGYKENSTSYSV